MAGGIARQLFYGDRPTVRFRTYTGDLIDPLGLPYALVSVATWCWLVFTGRRVALPFISLRATRHIKRKILTPEARVLEFGSGMSTLWFARHCGTLVSRETEPEWYYRVSQGLKKRSPASTIVDYRLCQPREWASSLRDQGNQSFDLVLIDGPARDIALLIALTKVRPGGFIYLDNTDMPYARNQRARRELLKVAGALGEVRRFIDFTPCRLHVTEGILAKVGAGVGQHSSLGQ